MARINSETQFAQWLERALLTQLAASELLGISVTRVRDLCAGASCSRGDPAYPTLAQRLAMAAIAAQLKPMIVEGYPGATERTLRLALAAARRNLEPWPVEPEALAGGLSVADILGD